MSHLVARLVLAMLTLPLTGTVFVVMFMVTVPTAQGPTLASMSVLWIVVYAFVATYWIAIWYGVVRWTRGRIWATAAAAPAALLLGVCVGMVTGRAVPAAGAEIATLVGGGVVPIAWVVATVWIWKETAAERAERLAAMGRETVSCPLCGYNLTGLHEARCPECGARFTLDQLLATQPKQKCGDTRWKIRMHTWLRLSEADRL